MKILKRHSHTKSVHRLTKTTRPRKDVSVSEILRNEKKNDASSCDVVIYFFILSFLNKSFRAKVKKEEDKCYFLRKWVIESLEILFERRGKKSVVVFISITVTLKY